MCPRVPGHTLGERLYREYDILYCMNTKILIIIIILVLVFLGIGSWFFFFRSSPTLPDAPDQHNAAEERIVRPTKRSAPSFSETDKDGDGVDDEVEAREGTSTVSADTDSDGITDKDEIEKWKTDPTKKDTDEDGFSDLQELLNGYNPTGDGPLVQ